MTQLHWFDQEQKGSEETKIISVTGHISFVLLWCKCT